MFFERIDRGRAPLYMSVTCCVNCAVLGKQLRKLSILEQPPPPTFYNARYRTDATIYDSSSTRELAHLTEGSVS